MIGSLFERFKRHNAPPPSEEPIEETTPAQFIFKFEASDSIVLYRSHATATETSLADIYNIGNPNDYWPTVLLFNREVEEFLLERGVRKIAQFDSKEIRYHEVHSNWQSLVFQNEQDLVEFKLRYI